MSITISFNRTLLLPALWKQKKESLAWFQNLCSFLTGWGCRDLKKKNKTGWRVPFFLTKVVLNVYFFFSPLGQKTSNVSPIKKPVKENIQISKGENVFFSFRMSQLPKSLSVILFPQKRHPGSTFPAPKVRLFFSKKILKNCWVRTN